MTQDPASFHRVRQQALLTWLESEDSTPAEPAEAILQRPIPEVSEELEQLLWLYADDLTTPQDEERLWELAAQESESRPYLERIYAAQQHVSRSVVGGNTSGTPASTWPTSESLAALPGVAVRFSENQLQMTRRSGQPVASQYTMARSAGELVTRIIDEQTLACGTLKVDVSRRPDGTYDVSLSLSQLVSGIDADTLSAQLLANESVVSESPLTNSAVRFRKLQPDSYVVVVTSVTGILDRFVIDIESP